jgi:aryl-alcohol dehydrogenase-like predicted oxidoreductase
MVASSVCSPSAPNTSPAAWWAKGIAVCDFMSNSDRAEGLMVVKSRGAATVTELSSADSLFPSARPNLTSPTMNGSRREFLRATGASLLLTGAARSAAGANAVPDTGAAIPRRPLGKTGAQVSVLGIGGSHLGETKNEAEAVRIVQEAVDAGVNFFDNAWEYHDGVSEVRLGKGLKGRRDRAFLMTKVCTHGRPAAVAMKQLEQSLKRLQTDHLDLWQVHECVYFDDPERHFAKGGVIEALDKAKQQGKVRFVGFTGHKHPDIHLAMLSHGYPFDTCQMPLNCFDASYRSFEKQVLTEVNRRGMGALGMKSLCGSGDPVQKGAVAAEEAIRYAMSLPVATTITGVDSLDVLQQNLAIARGFVPMPEAAMAALRKRVAGVAEDGALELYKTTKHFDAREGRVQHGYPLVAELPL